MLDELDRRILELLRKDARMSARAISRETGSSTPTIVARVKRLEDMGVIAGYTIILSTDEHRRRRALPRKIEVACAYCKKPVYEATRLRLGGRDYYVCCPSCEELLKRKYAKLLLGEKRPAR